MEHESVLDKHLTLVLNSSWMAIGVMSVRKAIIALCSGLDGEHPMLALDILMTDDGLEYANPMHWEDWIKQEVRESDLYIAIKNGKIRVPTVVIARNFNKILYRNPRLTNSNIFERDGWRCAYTGKQLTRKQATVDHIIPASRGGRNTWLNLITADKKINEFKANRTPEEAGLILLKKPVVPPSTPIVFQAMDARHETWIPFLVH